MELPSGPWASLGQAERRQDDPFFTVRLICDESQMAFPLEGLFIPLGVRAKPWEWCLKICVGCAISHVCGYALDYLP